MIRFESILKNELSEFLSIRKVSLSKSAFDHDCYYLKKFADYLVRCGCRIKELTEDTIMGWVSSLTGKSSSIANEVIVIRIFLSRLNSIGMQAYIPPVPKVADDYVPYIFSDIELDRIFILADNITMTKSQPNSYIQLEYPMVLRLMYGCGLRIGETLTLRMKDLVLTEWRKSYCMELCEQWLIAHDQCPVCRNKLIHMGGCTECITGDWARCG